MWVPVETIILDTDWTFTSSVVGEWFRVQHLTVPADEFRRGYIAQASAFAPVELQGIKRMYSKQEYDLYQLIKPDPWEERVIALREYLPSRAGQSWTVRIDVWQGVDEVIDTISEVAEQIAQLTELVRVFTGSVPDGFSPGRTEDDQLDGGQF